MNQQGGQSAEAKDQGKPGQMSPQAGQAAAGKSDDKGQAGKEAGQEKTADVQGGKNAADGKEGGKDSGTGAQQARGENKALSPEQAASAGKNEGRDGPKGAKDSGVAKSGEQKAGEAGKQGESKDSGKKSGDPKLASASGKGDPDHKPPSEADLHDIKRIANMLRNQDARKRELGAEELDRIKDQAQDPKMQELARKVLEELKKDPRNSLASNKPSEMDPDPKKRLPPDQPPCQCKGGAGAPKEGTSTAKGNSGMGQKGQGESKDGGKEKGPPAEQGNKGQNGEEGKGETAQGTGKTRGAPSRADSLQGQGEKTAQGDGLLEQLLQDRDQPPLNNKADALSQKATEAQLKYFQEMLDKKELERLKMTEEAREQFLKNYAELVKRDQAAAAEKPETPPAPQQGGTIGSSVGKGGPSGTASTGDTAGPNRGQPPPGYRDDYAEFTRMLTRPPRK